MKYAKADYWRAYAITFLTNERIIVASENVPRISDYQKLVDAHRDQAVRLSRENCPGGTMLMYKLWISSALRPDRTDVVLGQFTDQGIRNVEESSRRADALKDIANAWGHRQGGQLDGSGLVRRPSTRVCTTSGLESHARIGTILRERCWRLESA